MRPPCCFILPLKICIIFFSNIHSNKQIRNPILSVASRIGNLHGYIVDACLPIGATALDEPWPPLQPVSTVKFLNITLFYRMGLSAPCPTPILEDQGVSLSLVSYPLTLPAWVALLVVKLPPAFAVRVTESHKPHHHDKVETPLGGSSVIISKRKLKATAMGRPLVARCLHKVH
jgi:hypothetical protein